MMKRKSLWLCFVLVLAAVALGVAVHCRNVTTVEVVFAFSDYHKPELRENGKVNFVGMFDADEAPEYSGMDHAGNLLHDLNECKAQIVSNVTAVAAARQMDVGQVTKTLAKLRLSHFRRHNIMPILRLRVTGDRDVAEFVASEYFNAIDKIFDDDMRAMRAIMARTLWMLINGVYMWCEHFVVDRAKGGNFNEDWHRGQIAACESKANEVRALMSGELQKLLLVECPDSVARNVHITKVQLPPPVSGLELAVASGVDTNLVSTQCITWKCPQAIDIDGMAVELQSVQISTNRYGISPTRREYGSKRWSGKAIVEFCESGLDAIDKAFSRAASTKRELSVQRDGEVTIITADLPHCPREKGQVKYFVYRNIYFETLVNSSFNPQEMKSLVFGGCQ